MEIYMNKKPALRILSVLTLLFVLTSVLLSCSSNAVGDYTVNTKTVMKIDGNKISYDEYRCFYLKAMNEIAAGDNSIWDKEDAPFDELKETVERSLARKYATLKLAKKYKIKLSSQDKQDINDTVQYYIDENGGLTGYRQWLSTEGLTGRLFREQYTLIYYYDEYLRDILLTGIDDLIKVDDKTVSADVHENFYHYTWIFIPFGELDNYQENAKKIEEAFKALENGEDFYEVAERYSEWMGNEKIGIYATKGEKIYTIENTVLKLEENEYSRVLALDEGHAILMRLPMDSNYINEHFDDFVYQSGTRRYNELLDNMALEMKIEYTDYYDTLTMDMLTSSKEYFTGTN